MHTDAVGIGCIKAGNVGQCGLAGRLFLRIVCCVATTIQEAEERFVRSTRIHLLEYVVDIREEVTTAQSSLPRAPQVARDFCDPYISRLKRFQCLRWEPVDKLGAELNRSLANWIPLREHPSADAVASLKNSDGETGASQLSGSRQS